jgi:hypothetical protein
MIRCQCVGVPIMVCVGTEDVLVRPSNSYMIHKILGSRLEEFKGSNLNIIDPTSVIMAMINDNDK